MSPEAKEAFALVKKIDDVIDGEPAEIVFGALHAILCTMFQRQLICEHEVHRHMAVLIELGAPRILHS